MHTPDVIQQILSEIANWNLKNVKFWSIDEGAQSPITPINPYLRGNMWKKEPLFTYLFIYAHFGNLILELNMVPGVLLEPYMSQGDQGVTETPIVLKGLRFRLGWEHLKWKKCQKWSGNDEFWPKMSIIKFHPVLANMFLTLLIPSLWLK